MTQPTPARLLAASTSLAVLLGLVAGYRIVARARDADSDDLVRLDQAASPAPTENNRPIDGVTLPPVALRRLDGTHVDTTDLIGTPLIINVWYSTCQPCEKELPDLARVQREVSDRIRFVGVDTFPASVSEEAFARDRGVDYELLYDADGTFTTILGIATAPTTLFVTADGTIVDEIGVLTEGRLRQIIAEVFP